MDAFVGEIKLWTCAKLPENWVICNGQALAIGQYQELYSLLGTIYGGDGVNTFAVPNLTGRVAVNEGQGTGLANKYLLGQIAGTETVTLTAAQTAAHSHSVIVSTQSANQAAPTNNLLAAPSATGTSSKATCYITRAGSPTLQELDGSSIPVSGGGNGSHTNMMPYLVSNYIICTMGYYPTFP